MECTLNNTNRCCYCQARTSCIFSRSLSFPLQCENRITPIDGWMMFSVVVVLLCLEPHVSYWLTTIMYSLNPYLRTVKTDQLLIGVCTFRPTNICRLSLCCYRSSPVKHFHGFLLVNIYFSFDQHIFQVHFKFVFLLLGYTMVHG